MTHSISAHRAPASKRSAQTELNDIISRVANLAFFPEVQVCYSFRAVGAAERQPLETPMDMSGTTPLDEFLAYLLLALYISPPIALFVFRRHLSGASGWLRVAKGFLVAASVVSAPILGGLVLVVILGGWDELHTLWSLLREVW
jgi:hypothetical protein